MIYKICTQIPWEKVDFNCNIFPKITIYNDLKLLQINNSISYSELNMKKASPLFLCLNLLHIVT